MLADLRFTAASLAGFLLTLAAIAAVGGAAPTGLPVSLVSRSALPSGVACVEQRMVVIRVAAPGELHINTEPVTRQGLARRLDELFRTRAERVAFVLAAPALDFGEVAEVLDMVRGVVPNVGLLTPSAVPTTTQPLLRGAFPVRELNGLPEMPSKANALRSAPTSNPSPDSVRSLRVGPASRRFGRTATGGGTSKRPDSDSSVAIAPAVRPADQVWVRGDRSS